MAATAVFVTPPLLVVTDCTPREARANDAFTSSHVHTQNLYPAALTACISVALCAAAAW